MKRLDKNKLVLDTHLEELSEIVSVSEFPLQAKMLLPLMNWGIMDAGQKQLVNDLFKKRINIDRTLFNSLFISAVASFESFLSQTIESVVQLLNENFKNYNSYQEVFINRQIEFSGKMLSSIYSPPQHANIDFYKLCKNIGTIYPTSTTLTLNPEISAYFRNILELESFSNFFEDLDIAINIEAIAKVDNVKAAFKSRGQRDTEKLLEAFLKDIIKLRNRIAHTGQSASDLSKERINDLIAKLKAIAEAMTEILQTELSKLFKAA